MGASVKRKCCCGTPCGCATLQTGGGSCTHCVSGSANCTPKYVRAVVSGVGTLCGVKSDFSRSYDCTTATLSGTFLCSGAINTGFFDVPSACQWGFDDPAGSPTFNFRSYSGSTCNAAQLTSQNDTWGIRVCIDDQTAQGRGKVVKVFLFGGTLGDPYDYVFCGQTSFVDCRSTYTISNGNMYSHTGGLFFAFGGSGGTITLTFCP